MTSETREGPAADRTQETATTTNQATGYSSLGHEGYMRQLESRIRWLSTRRSDGRYPTHWWLREFIKRRDAA